MGRNIISIYPLKLFHESTFLSLDYNTNGNFCCLTSLKDSRTNINVITCKGTLLRKFNLSLNQILLCVIWNPFDNTVITGWENGNLIILSWNEKFKSDYKLQSPITCLFVPKKEILFSGEKSGNLIKWVLEDTKLIAVNQIECNRELLMITLIVANVEISSPEIIIAVTKESICLIENDSISNSIQIKDAVKKAFINQLNQHLYIITQSLVVMEYSINPLALIYETKISGHSNTLSIASIQHHILGFATGDHSIKFLDMKMHTFDTLVLTKDLCQEDDSFLSLDFSIDKNLLAAGTHMGALFIWHTERVDPLDDMDWRLIYHAHDMTPIKELKWRPSGSNDLGTDLMILSPRKISILEDRPMPVYCSDNITVGPTSCKTLVCEAIVGNYESYSGPITLDLNVQMRGYTYGNRTIIVWDDRKFYLYRIDDVPNLSLPSIGKPVEFPPPNDASTAYECHKCLVWEERAYAYFHKVETDPLPTSTRDEPFHSSPKTPSVYTFSIKRPNSPSLMVPIATCTGVGGDEGNVQNFNISSGILSLCSTTNYLKAIKLRHHDKRDDEVRETKAAYIVKNFSSFRTDSWELADALNNSTGTVFSLMFRKKFSIQIDVVILWDHFNDILFPVDIDPLQIHPSCLKIRDQFWDERYPDLFAMVFEISGEDGKVEQRRVMSYLVSGEGVVEVLECIELTVHQNLIKIQYPYLIYSKLLPTGGSERDTEVDKLSGDVLPSSSHSQNIIVRNFPTFDFPVPPEGASNGGSYTVVTMNCLRHRINLSPLETAQLLDIFSSYTFGKWEQLYKQTKALDKPHMFGYLTYFFLKKNELEMAQYCCQFWMGEARYNIFKYLVDVQLPYDLGSTGILEDAASLAPFKIAACYAYTGLLAEAIETLDAIALKGGYVEKEASQKLLLNWANRPDQMDVCCGDGAPLYTSKRAVVRKVSLGTQKILYHQVPRSISDAREKIKALLETVVEECSPETALHDVTSILLSIKNAGSFKSQAQYYDEVGSLCYYIDALAKDVTVVPNCGKDLTDTSLLEFQPPSSTKTKSLLYVWLAQYAEVVKDFDKALEYYGRANDGLAIVKVYCKLGNLNEAVTYAQEHDNTATYFYLGQRYERQGDNLESIKFFMSAKAYSIALNLCKANNLEEELFELSADFPVTHRTEIAKYFERALGCEGRAEVLYKNVGNYSKALKMALKTENMESLSTLVDELDMDLDAGLLGDIITAFLSHNQIERAVRLYLKLDKFQDAIVLCVNKYLTYVEVVANDILKKIGDNKNLMVDILSLNRNNNDDLIERLAECATKTGHHHVACKIYATILGDKIQAMKSLIRSGNVFQIVQFAQISRNPEIYVLAANYLQTTNGWRTDQNVFKMIVENYTKAKAYPQLITFFESCAQNTIEESSNYSQGLTFLHQASKYIPKLLDSNMVNRGKYGDRVRAEMENIRQYLQAQKCVKENDLSSMGVCQHLLIALKDMEIQNEVWVKVKKVDILALMVIYLTKNGRFSEAEKIIADIKAISDSLDMENLLGKDVMIKLGQLKIA